MTQTVYLPKAEMERLSAAIVKPTSTPAYFIGVKQNTDDAYAELRQLAVCNGQVAFYREYADSPEDFDEVQVGVYRSLADNSLVVQYESDYHSLVIKEYTKTLFKRKNEE